MNKNAVIGGLNFYVISKGPPFLLGAVLSAILTASIVRPASAPTLRSTVNDRMRDMCLSGDRSPTACDALVRLYGGHEEVTAADGRVLDFPAGTADSVINRAASEYNREHRR